MVGGVTLYLNIVSEILAITNLVLLVAICQILLFFALSKFLNKRILFLKKFFTITIGHLQTLRVLTCGT